MNTLYLAIIVSFLFSSIMPAWASVDLNAFLPISGNLITPEFKFSKLIVITYPTGGKLKSLLDGQNKTVTFTQDSGENPSIKKLMDDINSQLATQTPATITDLQVNYHATVTGGPYHTDIVYSITLIPTLQNYVLSQGQSSNPTVLDASWMTFDEKEPVMIPTQEYGNLEINYLIDFIKSQLPDVYNIIKRTDAENVLQQNLIDSHPLFTTPLHRWDNLFDPSYTLTPTVPFGGIGRTIAVTTFETGFSVQDYNTRIGGAEFSSDTDYHLDILEHQSAGTINVEGHANAYFVQGKPVISTALQGVNTGSMTPVGGLSIITVYAIISLIIAAIGTSIFFWLRGRK